MKFTIPLLAAVAGLAASQNLEGQPTCATPCLVSAISAVCTPVSDTACACASQAAIGVKAAPCLISACSNAADLGAAQSAGSAKCVPVPTTATATGTGTAASSSGVATGPGNTTTVAVGTSATGVASSSTASGSASPGATVPASGGVLLGPAVGGGILAGTLFVIAVLL